MASLDYFNCVSKKSCLSVMFGMAQKTTIPMSLCCRWQGKEDRIRAIKKKKKMPPSFLNLYKIDPEIKTELI